MITYCILKKIDSEEIVEITETGFCFLAFIFGPIWGLFKSLWLYSFIGIGILVSLNYLFNSSDIFSFLYLSSLSSSFFWGVFGRDLYIQKLISNKFLPITHLNATSKEKAMVKYLSDELK